MEYTAIQLSGHCLTLEQVEQIARFGCPVELDTTALETVAAARRVVEKLSDSPRQIYGLNTGLGANKDNRIQADEFHRFNERIIFSHSVAIPPFAPREIVRATMLCRLNSLLNGFAGVRTEMLILLRDMLNQGIHPQIPERGSVGMSDLGNMAYLGLALIGRGQVEYQGQLLPAGQALRTCGLSPLVLDVKEGLPVVSSSAFSIAKAALLCQDIGSLLDMADRLYALEFEALDMNPMFLDQRVLRGRYMAGHAESLRRVKADLNHSVLWDSKNQSLYGALSYKSSCSIHGAVRDAFTQVADQLGAYLNATDDCPMVLTQEEEIISSDHFILTGLAIQFEMLNIALAHLSKLIANRLMRLDNEHFSGLPRFLRPSTEVIGYATMQKTISALDGEISHLANPASLYYLPTANESEDHGCNTPYVLSNTAKILDNLYYLLGIEAMHGAQAADMRHVTPSGQGTLVAYQAVRSKIPCMEEDCRDLGGDICLAYELIKQRQILKEEPTYDTAR